MFLRNLRGHRILELHGNWKWDARIAQILEIAPEGHFMHGRKEQLLAPG